MINELLEEFMKPNLNRRKFVGTIVLGGSSFLLNSGCAINKKGDNLAEWKNPPREFSQAPFWFWNDTLSEKEILRQLKDFCDHGVYGFVIHPRAGLPKDTGWMSDKMIRYMRYTIKQAKKLNMWVVLYDEGMYPSGSSSGQVVAEDPSYRPRGFFAIDLDEVNPGDEKQGFQIGPNGHPVVEENQKLVAVVPRKSDGHRIAILDRYITPGYSLIRGLHFVEEDPGRRPNKKEVAEEMPPLGDILNPEAMLCFIRLVYQRFYDEFGKDFGETIKAVFTDEPSFFGKRGERGAKPGNADVLEFVSKWLVYDFKPHLPKLFFNNEPEAQKYRDEYDRALEARLEQTYYGPISKWCSKHNIALTGHPADPDDIGHLRHFQMPGQDIVWRYIEPGRKNALEGPQTTQAKCASSAMVHLGRRRNSNEYCGAYGHNFTFREMKWLANWLLIRGCNLLYPHAFYYSIRGPRVDERPPDVGPNNVWWDQFKSFADATSRLCWLNTDSKHICDVAILGLNDYLPWESAKVCFQNQIDFNYLEARHLWEDAIVDEKGIHIQGMLYKALILQLDGPQQAKDALEKLRQSGRLIIWNEINGEENLLKNLNPLIQKDISISPRNKDLRFRHVQKNDADFYILFNEGEDQIQTTFDFSAKGNISLLDIETGEKQPSVSNLITMAPHQVVVVMVKE
jgi:hypothetical protein